MLIFLVVLVLLLVLFRFIGVPVVRRKIVARVEAASIDILEQLAVSGKPMNVTELEQATGRSGGMVVQALNIMHKRGMVSSTRDRNRLAASADVSRYAITKAGKKYLSA